MVFCFKKRTFSQGRPDSGRYGKRSDNRRSDDKRQEDRQTVNRRDRRDITESRGSDHGRDEHYRKESGNENGRNDQRPDSRRRRDISSESKPKDREPLSKTSDPGKDVKPCRELEREQGSPLMRETKDKESSAASNESKPPEEEAKGTTKYEKKGSESERRLRNKVKFQIFYFVVPRLSYLLGGFHATSSPPCCWTKTKDLSLGPFVHPPAIVH